MNKYTEKEINKYLNGPILDLRKIETIKDPRLQVYLLEHFPICYEEYFRILFKKKNYDVLTKHYKSICGAKLDRIDKEELEQMVSVINSHYPIHLSHYWVNFCYSQPTLHITLNYQDERYGHGKLVENWFSMKKKLLQLYRTKLKALNGLEHSFTKEEITNQVKCGFLKEAVINMCTLLEAKLRMLDYRGDFYSMLCQYRGNGKGEISSKEKDLLHRLRMDRNSYIHFSGSKDEHLSKEELLNCLDIIFKIEVK
ncbi:MAG: hypothetical protein MJ211_14310 [Bacteroidales bacterium]|nr:hypothetical protein [Bacteroidales bacterium]